MTNFRTSPSVPDAVPGMASQTTATSGPVLPGEYLAGHLGTSPTLTVPATFGRLADLAAVWAHLAEAAEFFGVPMPAIDELGAACTRFLRDADEVPLLAVHVIIVEIDSATRVLVTGEAVPARSDSVRVEVTDDVSPLVGPGGPRWRRMAARTTSKAVEDRLRRGFDDRGCADCVGADAVPFLGALVFEAADATYGIENPEPTSVLDQLRDCGAVTGIQQADRIPADAKRAWWISPRFETCPVTAVGSTTYSVDAAAPIFARCA